MLSPLKLTRNDLLAIILVVILILAALTARGYSKSIGNPQRDLGVPEFTINPNTYIMGYIISGVYVRDDYRVGTVLRIQPSYTYLLYTQDLLFCGEIDPNEVKTGLVIITYRTVAHEAIAEIGCHRLMGIDEVKPKETP